MKRKQRSSLAAMAAYEVDEYRQLQNSNLPSVPLFFLPPSESTLLMDLSADVVKSGVPNFEAGTQGDVADVNLSAPISGIELFQYNDMFWGNNIPTFNQSNSLVGLILFSWKISEKSGRILCMPIVLPPLANCTFADQTRPDHSPDNYRLLLQQVAYVLNMFFASGDTTAQLNSSSVWPRAWCVSSNFWNRASGTDTYAPYFHTGSLSPPLRWVVSVDNHLCLFDNSPNDSNYSDYKFAFNLVQLDATLFTDSSYYYRPTGGNAVFRQDFLENSSPAINDKSMFGENLGWFSHNGRNVLGFGWALVPPLSTLAFTDDYDPRLPGGAVLFPIGSVTRPAIYTFFQNPRDAPMSIANQAAFDVLVFKLRLRTGVLYAPVLPCLTPSRYYTISSNALSQNQRRAISSNSFHIPAETIGFVTPSFKNSPGNLWSELNISSATAGVESSTATHFSQNSNPTLHIRASESKRNIDLTIRDESGLILRNPQTTPVPLYVDNIPANLNFSSLANYYVSVTNTPSEMDLRFLFTWLLAINPDGANNPDGQSCIAPYGNISQRSMWGLKVPTSRPKKPVNLDYSLMPGSNWIHFGRLLK
jgi:hypothetical protein